MSLRASVQPAKQRPWRSVREDLKRDYVAGADLRDAESVLLQLTEWIEDYNTRAPHSALGMRSPAAYRAVLQPSSLSEGLSPLWRNVAELREARSIAWWPTRAESSVHPHRHSLTDRTLEARSALDLSGSPQMSSFATPCGECEVGIPSVPTSPECVLWRKDAL
ncbi:MAG: hypothetical protein EHM89_13205 [Acidobacteria bacterium]|nr:MAG: hypothetical protein EHM89_13205 [Acidobacteriota bacterium]